MHRIDIQLFCVFVFQSSVYETDSIHSAWRWRIYQAFSRWTRTQWTLNSSVGAVANPSRGYFQREGTRTQEAGRSVRRNGSQSGGCTRRITTESPNGWFSTKTARCKSIPVCSIWSAASWETFARFIGRRTRRSATNRGATLRTTHSSRRSSWWISSSTIVAQMPPNSGSLHKMGHPTRT